MQMNICLGTLNAIQQRPNFLCKYSFVGFYIHKPTDGGVFALLCRAIVTQ